jgi:hypothetical protein
VRPSGDLAGLIELIKPLLRRGARVKILHGPFRDHLAIFADMKPRARVEILLEILGEQSVELAQTGIEVHNYVYFCRGVAALHPP